MTTYTEDTLLALRDRHEAWLMAQEGLIGTGIGLGSQGQVLLRIFTKGMKQATRQAIAAKLGDVPLDWEEGEVIAS